MGLFRSYSGYRIPSQNLSAEIRVMKTDMERVKNAGWLINGSAVPLSEEQKKLLSCRITGIEDDVKGTKRSIFFWLLVSVGTLVFYTREVILYIFPVVVVLLIFGYYFTVKRRNDLVSAYEHNSYRAYSGTITDKKWGKTYGEDEEYYFFLVVNGVNVRVKEQFYESCSVNDRVMIVILNWEKKDYLVLLQCKESNALF